MACLPQPVGAGKDVHGVKWLDGTAPRQGWLHDLDLSLVEVAAQMPESQGHHKFTRLWSCLFRPWLLVYHCRCMKTMIDRPLRRFAAPLQPCSGDAVFASPLIICAAALGPDCKGRESRRWCANYAGRS